MNFTREPIVETIISAKEGYKLSLKSSKHQASEEYVVDAVEVVSFSGALFYRSQEKPKPFFLPIHDYEVQEVREARVTIKSPVVEKSIKISGGKQHKQHAESEEKVPTEIITEGMPVPSVAEGSTAQAQPEQQREQRHRHGDGKRDKRQKYRNKRRGFEEGQPPKEVQNPVEGALTSPPPESVFSHLLKPPEALISESIHRYKTPENSLPPKTDDPELFSEPPREYERLQDEGVEAEHLIFSPTDPIKPQE